MKKIIFYASFMLLVSATNAKEYRRNPTDNSISRKDPKKEKIDKKCREKVTYNKCNDTLVNKETYYVIINEKDSLQHIKDSLMQRNVTLSNSNVSLQERLNKLKVDEFLNIQDSTIFGSNFRAVDESSIPVRNRDFYKLIKYIHDLNIVLNQKGPATYKYKDQRNLAKSKLDNAKKILDDIATFGDNVYNWLTKEQIEYYKQQIKDLNDLDEDLNEDLN